MSTSHLEFSIETTNIILICLTGIYAFIITPIQIYYSYEFWKNVESRIPFFNKRHPKLVLFGALLINLYPLLFRPLADFTEINGILDPYHPIIFFSSNMTQLYAIIVTMRLWLLYYDFTREGHVLKIKWTSLYLVEESHKLPWTIKYRWMGDMRHLSAIGISVGVIIIFFVTAGSAIWPAHITYTQSCGFFLLGFILMLAVRIRNTRDNLCIKKEFKVYGLLFLVYIIWFVIIQFTLDHGTNIRVVNTNIYNCVMTFLFGLTSTFWVIREYKQQNLRHLRRRRTKSIPAAKRMASQSSSSKNALRLTLEEILSTKDGFHLFANHLVREFSTENLFFLLEMNQIKAQALQNKLVDTANIGLRQKIAPSLLNKTRKHREIKSMTDVRTVFKYIRDEYIRSYSRHCINISSFTRSFILLKLQDTETPRTPAVSTQMEMWELDKLEEDTKQNGDGQGSPISVDDEKSKEKMQRIPQHTPITEEEKERTTPLPQVEKQAIPQDTPTITQFESEEKSSPFSIVFVADNGDHKNGQLECVQDGGDYEMTGKYLRIFDEAMNEVLSLLRSDTLQRFYETEDYLSLSDAN